MKLDDVQVDKALAIVEERNQLRSQITAKDTCIAKLEADFNALRDLNGRLAEETMQTRETNTKLNDNLVVFRDRVISAEYERDTAYAETSKFANNYRCTCEEEEGEYACPIHHEMLNEAKDEGFVQALDLFKKWCRLHLTGKKYT